MSQGPATRAAPAPAPYTPAPSPPPDEPAERGTGTAPAGGSTRRAARAAGRRAEDRRRRAAQASAAIAVLVVTCHLAAGYVGARLLRADAGDARTVAAAEVQARIFAPVGLSGEALCGALFVTGAVLFSLLSVLRLFGAASASPGRRALGASALSLAVSLLLSADAAATSSGPRVAAAEPQTLWGALYRLATERGNVALLALAAVAAVVVCTYAIARSVLTVEYQGAGIQVRLPGQTVYYLPIYPQISWQNTHIAMRAGDRISVEISGYVSPGALGELDKLAAHMKDYLRWAEAYNSAATPAAQAALAADYSNQVRDVPTWEYSGPEGYPERWYAGKPEEGPAFLREHPLYRRANFFKQDPQLTVTGLPHNVVVGMICGGGDPEPQPARPGQHDGYVYDEHRDRLLYLSSKHYPITLEANHTGELWVVINDADIARWDNSGMFFLKITRHSWV